MPASDSQVYTLTRAFWRQSALLFSKLSGFNSGYFRSRRRWRNISGWEGCYCALWFTSSGWQLPALAEGGVASRATVTIIHGQLSSPEDDLRTWAAPLVTLTPMTVTSSKKFWLGECGLRERTQHWSQSTFKFQFSAHTGKFRACFFIFKMQWWPQKNVS